MVTVLADGPTELYRQLPSTVGRPHAAIPLPLSPLAQRFRRKTFEMQILNCRSAATLLVVRKHAETISTAPMNPILDLLPLLPHGRAAWALPRTIASLQSEIKLSMIHVWASSTFKDKHL